MQATKVTIERFAEIRAEMESGALRDDVLARAGLDADEWSAAQGDWLEQMSAEIERDRFELTNRYGAAFVARQTALAATKAEPPRADSAPVSDGPDTPLLAPRPSPSQQYAFPSAPPVPPPSPSQPYSMGEPAFAHSYAAPLHASPLPPPPPPSQPEMPTSVLEPPRVAPSPMPSPVPQRLPVGPPVIAPPQINYQSPVGRPKAAINKLLTQTMGPGDAAAPALPFLAGAIDAAASGAAASGAAASGAGAIGAGAIGAGATRPPQEMESTADQPSPIPKSPLPFHAGKAPPEIAQPSSEPPSADKKKGKYGALAETMTPMPSPIKAVLPFHKQPDPPTLTMEQHASLHAELLARPDQVEATLRKYRVTAETKTRLDEYWKQRREAEPAIRAGWDRAFQVYRAWLADQKNR